MVEMTENWTNETIIEFLSLYEKYPVIGDPQHANHKNRNSVSDAWAAIVNEMSVTCTVETLKKKKESLMATYRGLKKNVFDSEKSGAGVDDIYKPSWFAFTIMDTFFRKIGKCRSIINTDNDTNTPATTEHNDNEGDASVAEEGTDRDDTASTTSVRSNRKRKYDSSLNVIHSNMKKASEALDAIATNRSNRNDNQHECTLYGQLLAIKLQKFSKRSRLMLMNQIDNLIFEAELSEIDNNQCSSSRSTFTDQHSSSSSILSPDAATESRSLADYYSQASHNIMLDL